MISQSLISRAAEILRQGGLVVFPTETYYGIAADAANPEALQKLIKLKGRPPSKPTALIIGDQAHLEGLVSFYTPYAHSLMEEHWPGPLTLIMQARPGLHPSLTSLDGGLGVRLSPHPAAAGLARELGRAVTATSANLSGGGPVVRIADLDPAIAQGADLALDGGNTPGGPASTVLDVRDDPPLILRPGPIKIPNAV